MTRDLLCLVADRNMQSAISELLARPRSLGIRPITYRIERHPERDPGCFHRGAQYLANLRAGETHGLVLLDYEWSGVPAPNRSALESMLDADLNRVGLGDWARSVVIEPELEAWVFSRSNRVPAGLGWTGSSRDLRLALHGEDLWPSGHVKPPDPKAAMEWVLRRSKMARSSAIYADLAENVSTKNCMDPAFDKFRKTLKGWFP